MFQEEDFNTPLAEITCGNPTDSTCETATASSSQSEHDGDDAGTASERESVKKGEQPSFENIPKAKGKFNKHQNNQLKSSMGGILEEDYKKNICINGQIVEMC